MDWLFYRRWRLSHGWLDGPAAARALGIFHDPLAQAMRRTVVTRLHPEFHEELEADRKRREERLKH